MRSTPDVLSGTARQWMFSPKGTIEGVLLALKGRHVQVVMPPDVGAALVQRIPPGKRMRVIASADTSPKAAAGAHPVYHFESLADTSGQPVSLPGEDAGQTRIKGVVAAIHYAKHGQPNGVMLDGGEFIHLRPHGMAQTGLAVGAKVDAVGDVRMTVLGTRMLEAHQVNRVSLT